VALSNSDFTVYRSHELTNKLVEYFGNILNEESKRETLDSYGGGGFNISNI
jgi:hypothetical protein